MAFNWQDPSSIATARQKAIQAGYKPAQVDEFINQKKNEQAQLQLAQQGNLPDATFQDIAKNSPQAALQIAQSGYKPAMSAADKKKDETSKGLLGLTDSLKQLYNEPMANGQRPNQASKESLAKGGTGFMAPLNGALFDFSQVMTNRNVNAKSYKRAKEGFTASLKQLTGDTGVLTDQDFARIAQSLPSFSDSDATAKGAWQTIDTILKSKLGSAGQYSYLDEAQAQSPQAPQGQTQSGFPQGSIVPGNNPSMPAQPGLAVQAAQQRAQQQQPQGKGIFESVFGPQGPIGGALAPLATSSGGDLAAGIFEGINPSMANIAHKSAANQQLTGGDLAAGAGDVAMDILPWLKGLKGASLGARATGNIARNTLGGALQGATKQPGEGESRLGNAAGNAAQAGAVAGIFNVGGKLIKPFQSVGEMKQAAVANAAGKTVSGNTILEALRSGGKGLSPTVQQGYQKFLSQAEGQFAKQSLPIEDAVKLASSANDAYSAAGKVGKAASAKFNDVLAKAVKAEIQKVAPKVTQANKLFSLLYGTQRNVVKPITNIGVGIGGGALIGGALGKLGIGGGQQ